MKKLVEQTLDLIGRTKNAAPRAFVEEFCRSVPSPDLKAFGPARLAGIVQLHWTLSAKRRRGAHAIDIRSIVVEQDGAARMSTAIDIVNDDMAFLVDSTAAVLTGRYRPITALLHPIMRKGDAAESHIHIELQGALPDHLLEALRQDIETVLHDVRRATAAWQDMREELRRCHLRLDNAPCGEKERAEYGAFLDYLYHDNFTLLGFETYDVRKDRAKGREILVRDRGLGLLDGSRPGDAGMGLPSDLPQLRETLPPVVVSKLDKRSTVHRSVPLDAVIVKHYGDGGRVTGETLFIGLFTSVTYSRSIQDIPLLRLKAADVMALSGFAPGSHDYKGLRHILEKYPRDELFQLEEKALLETALSILQLQERHRIALYTRPDPIGQYISCLVYVPRDRYDTHLRIRMQSILETELGGVCGNFYTTLDDSPLARVMFLVYVPALSVFSFDREAVERKLQEAGLLWSERLLDSMRAAGTDEQTIARQIQRFGEAFPPAYTERYEPKQTLYDIARIETVLDNGDFALDLYQDKSCGARELRLKIYSRGRPIILSDMLPILENFGLRAISELPFEIRPRGDGRVVWIHDFLLTAGEDRPPIALESVKAIFEDALKGIWYGGIESDSLNALVVQAAMDWRQIQILRAYVRYMRQAGYTFGTPYVERTLTDNPDIARLLASLFHVRMAPGPEKGREGKADAIAAEIERHLEKVTSLDVDRTLRALLSLVQATLRTNFFQPGADGAPKAYLSLKFDSRAIAVLPEPRPFREIFVYSPRMEGIHLRMDWIARGGIRWSDRHEDFRTEILGLMKAQQVKNAVIVPMGAKGGFIVKNPPRTGGREALQKEGIECYRLLIRGLLDITDNRRGTKIVPPENVFRHDPDDPYLVVAADKGTASFSDIANALSLEYGFWLGDAFASGGSAGYDHKGMGITARGAWESVKRHFRELDHDTQTGPFDVIGVGDMGGDVFGNGLLQSECIRLVGAFNHAHVFCDPDPDPKASFRERKRLFDAVKGWDHYDTAKLSPGGRIYSRNEKSLTLTPEIRARFGLKQDRIAPADLIQAMLRSQTDLLFFGGIGTYIKATDETHADAGDKGNDSLRIDADSVRARVIGEGANLAVTQRARVEMALRGIRLNTDFIDNSAGVDTSDHEVNIKILMAAVMDDAKAGMTTRKRDTLLRSMTDEVAALVLRDNYQQTQGLSLAETRAAEHIDIHAAFIADLERHSSLSRRREALPDAEEIAQRKAQDKGLTRPELSVLLAYSKILFTQDLLADGLIDRPETAGWLLSYFPKALQRKYAEIIAKHRLHREIAATALSNELVNRMGPTFVKAMMDKTGAGPADVACAWLIVREAFALPSLWEAIEALDTKVSAAMQLRAMLEIVRLVERETIWFLTRLGRAPDLGKELGAFAPGIGRLAAELPAIATPNLAETIRHREDAARREGFPAPLAARLAAVQAMGSSCDIIRVARDAKADIADAARVYHETGDGFHFDWLRHQAHLLPPSDRWAAEAVAGLIEQLNICQAGLATRILKDMGGKAKGRKAAEEPEIVKSWMETHGRQAARIEPMFADMRAAGAIDLAMLALAEQRLRQLYGG